MKGNEKDQKSFTFKVAIILNQLMGCPYYFDISVPDIPDRVFSSDAAPTTFSFTKVALSDITCSERFPV